MLRKNVPESEPEFDEKLSLDFPDFKPLFKLSYSIKVSLSGSIKMQII